MIADKEIIIESGPEPETPEKRVERMAEKKDHSYIPVDKMKSRVCYEINKNYFCKCTICKIDYSPRLYS